MYHYYVDTNECDTGIHDCQQYCNNTIGSYMCYCDDGYELTDIYNCDGMVYSDIFYRTIFL